MLNQHREKFSGLSIKIGLVFSKIPLTPNQWTVFSILPVLISFYFLTQNSFLLAAVFFGAAAFLDFVDGSVARVTGRVTRFGAFLDTIVDRYVELIIVIGLFLIPLPELFFSHTLWLVLLLFGSTMTTYVKAAAKEKDVVEKELKGGLIERAERLILLFLGIITAQFNPLFLSAIIAVLAIGTNLTALQRILKAKKVNK